MKEKKYNLTWRRIQAKKSGELKFFTKEGEFYEINGKLILIK